MDAGRPAHNASTAYLDIGRCWLGIRGLLGACRAKLCARCGVRSPLGRISVHVASVVLLRMVLFHVCGHGVVLWLEQAVRPDHICWGDCYEPSAEDMAVSAGIGV